MTNSWCWKFYFRLRMKVCGKGTTVLFCTSVPRSVTSWRPSWPSLQTWAGKKSPSSLTGHQVRYIHMALSWTSRRLFWHYNFRLCQLEKWQHLKAQTKPEKETKRRVSQHLLMGNFESIFCNTFYATLVCRMFEWHEAFNWAFSHNQ